MSGLRAGPSHAGTTVRLSVTIKRLSMAFRRPFIQPFGQIARAALVLCYAVASGAVALASSNVQTHADTELRPSVVRLVMVEAAGCRFCAQWHAEIGPTYPNSEEGKFAPLKRVAREAPELTALKPVIYTPTFIVMRGTHEVGRIAGYPGQHYFWDELRPLLELTGFPAGQLPLP